MWMIYLIVALISSLVVGNIHFYQLVKANDEVIEEQNKIIKDEREKKNISI